MNINVSTTHLDLLVCPKTLRKLHLRDGELYSDKTSYPLFKGIPWMFKHPEFHFLEWATKISTHIREEQRYVAYLQLLIQQESAASTRLRLSQILEAKQHNLRHEHETLGFFLGQQDINLQPSTQQVHSYFKHIFRDWCWDNDENAQYFDYIKQKAPPEPQSILILGAGAGKLSQLVSQHYSHSQVYSVDHNPYLTLTAQDIFNGKKIALYDYSFFPKSVHKTHQRYNIEEKIKLNNHQFILSHFPDLPFPCDSFDLVIAPWFFDILETTSSEVNLAKSLVAVSKYLKADGTLIHIGPSNIHHHNVVQQLSIEEAHEAYAQQFAQVHNESRMINYLNGPLDTSNRNENVMFLSASQKTTITSKKTEQNNEQSGHDPILEIKLSPELASYKEMMTAKAKILGLIDGDMTLSELSKRIAKAFNLEAQQAEFYAESFVKKLYQDLS